MRPVRETIALLRREGLVTVQPQSGTYVPHGKIDARTC
ncbi:MAG: GntR family transcriptional regulator [Mesorhizobium sp.]|nr:MAG: GntR family transcriptional regulator [Mesorhizobium sp.]